MGFLKIQGNQVWVIARFPCVQGKCYLFVETKFFIALCDSTLLVFPTYYITVLIMMSHYTDKADYIFLCCKNKYAKRF